MAELQLSPGETLVKRLNANHVVKNWVFPVIGLTFKSGILFLTSERIIFHRRSTHLFFLVGVFAYKSDGTFAFDIPLPQVEEIRKGSAGLLGRTLCVVTRSGAEYTFVVKSAQLLEALEEALSQYHKARLIRRGDAHWDVEMPG